MDTVDERSKIPNLMRIGEIPSDMQMDYDTIPEDPVVNTQTFTRFVLSNRGFLDSNSKVIVGVSANASATVNALATLPAGVGAHAQREIRERRARLCCAESANGLWDH